MRSPSCFGSVREPFAIGYRVAIAVCRHRPLSADDDCFRCSTMKHGSSSSFNGQGKGVQLLTMSLKVMHWAWSIALQPPPKLLLMALADEADDRGFCFPSVPHLAKKCSIAERTANGLSADLHAKDSCRLSNGFARIAREPATGINLRLTAPRQIVTNPLRREPSGW